MCMIFGFYLYICLCTLYYDVDNEILTMCYFDLVPVFDLLVKLTILNSFSLLRIKKSQ